MRVFGNRALPKREQVAGGWRRLHSEELHNLYTQPGVIKIIKTRKMRQACHVARLVKIRNL
jgi:hypothetical protein